ncbi:MAG: transaldolase [Acidobacteria bacterium]|nr:transaldolase [Acidobacteriota bacterium]MCI0627970.1 transaldolase [Acidobacteriota bacterium]MCI0719872.1 transaldolase [Acidobacteriota bacterium]
MHPNLTDTRLANSLLELQAFGQSVWLDNISKAILDSGELKKLIDDDGLRGVTSNPTIFEKAINGSQDYDAALKQLAQAGRTVDEIYEALVIDDIRRATDLFRPLFRASGGVDGYVSLEVSPKLANETQRTLEEARRLWKQVDRPNVMIKVPGTPAGIPAFEQLISEGINVNVTLMFSMEHYVRVAEAYVRGLQARARNGQPLAVASVASFFVSRVDTLVDKQIEERIAQAATAGERQELESLLGKTAVANSRLVYQKFKEIFSRRAFLELKDKGAQVQRPLWASTSAKNPKYRDVLYAEELIGPDTVDTMPPATIDAFREHGRVRASLEEGLAEAKDVFGRLAGACVDMDAATEKLQVDGVKLFADSFDTLMKSLDSKRQGLAK